MDKYTFADKIYLFVYKEPKALKVEVVEGEEVGYYEQAASTVIKCFWNWSIVAHSYLCDSSTYYA